MRLLLSIIVVPLACLLLAGFDKSPRLAPELCQVQVLNVPEKTPFSMKALRGRVVLVVFYNPEDAGLETLMTTLKGWYAQYRESGLEIVAVYSPHWAYQNADSRFFDLVKKFGVTFPIMEDKFGRTCAAYNEFMSPSIFCVDKKGFIRAQFSGVFAMNDVRMTFEDLLGELP